jgi:sugar/nucleoside kinase (ribokinase family)
VFDIVSVGHFVIDSILLPNRNAPFVILGGSPTYVSLAARRLDAKVGAVSKVGGDFPSAYLWWLRQEGIDLSGITRVEDAHTTRYELKYSNDLSDRLLRLKNMAPPITLADLPSSLKARIIHIGPVAGEIAYEVVAKLKEYAEILSLDPQGLVRGFDENGNVIHVQLADTRILELVDIFKSSTKEIESITGLSDMNLAMNSIHEHGVKIVVVTSGANGATVSVEDAVHVVPAFKSEKVVDPTGAGDAFIGGFLAEYVRGEDISRCSYVGSAIASTVVEGIGPTHFGDKTEIYRRASLLYGKEIKG